MLSLTVSQLRITVIFFASLLVLPLAAIAQDIEQAKEAQQVVEEVQSGTSVTVYVDAKFGKRTKGAAKALTKSHEKYRQEGYRLADLDLYTENGDLEGFFVTYIKN